MPEQCGPRWSKLKHLASGEKVGFAGEPSKTVGLLWVGHLPAAWVSSSGEKSSRFPSPQGAGEREDVARTAHNP